MTDLQQKHLKAINDSELIYQDGDIYNVDIAAKECEEVSIEFAISILEKSLNSILNQATVRAQILELKKQLSK